MVELVCCVCWYSERRYEACARPRVEPNECRSMCFCVANEGDCQTSLMRAPARFSSLLEMLGLAARSLIERPGPAEHMGQGTMHSSTRNSLKNSSRTIPDPIANPTVHIPRSAHLTIVALLALLLKRVFSESLDIGDRGTSWDLHVCV